ncbi:MAG: hypothetical protein BWY72_02550 [Bacteroidetes bacterium ADurb.Bin416]|nr:MAG: hypothetical protein BWY72_02550 [Bacteroidetes bacterium ADurb.Bin416]
MPSFKSRRAASSIVYLTMAHQAGVSCSMAGSYTEGVRTPRIGIR